MFRVEAVVDNLCRARRTLLRVVNVSDQRIRIFVVVDELALASGVIAGREGPYALLRVGDIYIVVDNDIFCRPDACLLVEQYFGEPPGQFISSEPSLGAPV